MNMIFVGHIGNLIEVSIDDMMENITENGRFLTDLEVVFGCL